MLRWSITTNAAELERRLDKFADQIPFGTALALTRTAQEVQGYERDHLDDHMRLRGGYVRNSIRYRPARKGPSPVAYVGSVYAPMALQVEGGEKEGQRGRDIAIPVWARRDESKVTRPSQWPGRLTQRRNFFIAPIGDSGDAGVYQRMGRKGRIGLRLWWVLRESVQVKPSWPFYEEASMVVRENFADNWWAAMEQATRGR